VTITLTEARKKADRQLSYGWYRWNATDSGIYCPDCRTKLTVVTVAWATDAVKNRELRTRLVEHLREDCEAAA
jgi:hypothetical protein